MADLTANNSAPSPRRWLRRLAIVFAVLMVLLVAAYFVLTSASFLKGVILPRVSTALNAQVTLGDASISPFSSVTLQELKVQTTGAEPLLSVREVRLRYSLSAILAGRINVSEIALVSPTVTLIRNADGTSNLDPVLKAAASGDKSGKKPAPSAASAPPQLDLRKFDLSHGTVRVVTRHAGGGQDQMEVSDLTLTLAHLKNAGSGALTLAANLAMDNQPPAPGARGSWQGTVTGNLDLGLAADLNLAALKGSFRVEVPKAAGAFAELATTALALEAELAPTEIKEVALRFRKGGTDLGSVRATGPFNLATSEGTVKVELLPVDKRLLNLAGAAAGIDFGNTTVASAHTLTLTRGGKQLAAKGSLNVSALSITQKGLTTPSLDVRLAYDTSADLNQESAVLGSIAFDVLQNRNPLLRASLSSPMTVAWGAGASPGGDAGLSVVLTNLSLADWKAFAPELDAVGLASAVVNVTSKQAGKQLAVDLAARLDGLGVTVGSNRIAEATVELSALTQVAEFKKVTVPSYRLALNSRAAALATLTGSAAFNADNGNADAELALDIALERVLQLLPQAGLRLTSGRARLDSKAAVRGAARTASGSLRVDKLTGDFGQRPFADLALGAAYDVGLPSPGVVELRQCQVTLAPTRRVATNQLSLTGRMDLSRTNALEGALRLAAEALDVTPYYDLVADQPKPAAATGAPAESSTPGSARPPGGTPTEPAAVALPVKLLAFDVALARCYLRELDLSKVIATARVEGSHVTLKPVQLQLNGAPLQADVDLDLGVPGFRYAVHFDADKLPIEPLANSFSPAYRGQAQGVVLANLDLRGAGVTDPSLQKNLAGAFHFTFTNANIQIVGPKAKAIVGPIALLLGVNDLLSSPVNWMNTRLTVGEGKVHLSDCNVVSAAFTAATSGDIALAAVLTNSVIQNWPVKFSLRRSLAERSHLVPKDAPADAAYVLLPPFVELRGTVGNPKPHTDKVALLGLGAQAIGALPGVGKEAEKALGKAGALLGAKPGGGTNAAPASQLLDLLKKPRKSK